MSVRKPAVPGRDDERTETACIREEDLNHAILKIDYL